MKIRWPIALPAVVLVAAAAYVLTYPPSGPWWDYQPFPTFDPAASTRFTQRTAYALLPEAASVSTADEVAMWEKLIAGDGRFRASNFPNHSLSVVVRFLSEEYQDDYENHAGKPEHWMKAAAGGLKAPAFLSVLQPENLTDVRITSQAGGTAKGEVEYATSAFRGRARFTARRSGGYWRIEAFELPSSGVRIQRGPDRIWRRTDSEGDFPFYSSYERLKSPKPREVLPTPGGV